MEMPAVTAIDTAPDNPELTMVGPRFLMRQMEAAFRKHRRLLAGALAVIRP